ncbi:MAG: MFS transporter [Actinomycetes bacterium]
MSPLGSLRKDDELASIGAEMLQRRILRTLSLAQIFNGIGGAGIVAAGSLLAASISKSESLAGLAQTMTVLGAALMALPLAKLTQKGGRRTSLMSGYVIGFAGAVLAVLGGVTKSLLLVLAGSLLVGAASASGYQARFAAIDLATPERRSRNLSFVVWGSTIGAVAGPNLMQPSGVVAQHFHLPRLVGPYLVIGLSLALSSLLIFLFLRPDPYLRANLSADGVTQRTHQSTKSSLSHIRAIPKALFAICAIGIGHLAMVSVMVMTPVHMSHVDVTLSVIGLVISVHVLGMYAFSPVVGILSDKWGRIKVIQFGVVLFVLAVTVAGVAPAMDPYSLGFGLFLLGLGWSCTLIAGSTLLSESVSVEMRPSSQGASDLVMNSMGALGGVMSGIILGTLSYGWLCLFVGVLVTLLGLWSLTLPARRLNGQELTTSDGAHS